MRERPASWGIADILGIIFIILKLCNTIDWSWWWVLSPFWIPMGLMLLIRIAEELNKK